MNKSTVSTALLITLAIGLGGGYWLARQDLVDDLLTDTGQSNDVGQATNPDPTKAIQHTLPYKSGPYRFAIQVEPETPVVGNNRLRLILADRDRQPVTGASIRAVAEMPAMGAMSAMQAPADMQETAPGIYEGDFKLGMRGGWPLTLSIEKAGLGQTQAGFDMATGREGLEPSSGVTTANGKDIKDETLPAGTITLDAHRRQLIGVTTGEAKPRSLTHTIRAVGQVTYDETRVADVSLKYDAWVGDLKADFVGAEIRKGQLLFTIYSPELYSAQQEYLDILRRGHEVLLAAARQRLHLWNMAPATIEALEKRGKPFEYIPVFAPRSGTLVEKHVVEGTAQKAGTTLMRIADLSHVWVEAELYEDELPLATEGVSATVTLPYLPDQRFEAHIDYVYPYLNARSRTGRIRLPLPNEHGLLKPDMYTEVRLDIPLGERLSVPEEAVIVAGGTRVVFEDLGDGQLAPRRVRTGRRTNGYIEILEGLEAGASVVTSGNFLIASESRLKSGIKQW